MIQAGNYPQHKALETRAQQITRELQPIPAIAASIRQFHDESFRPKMIGVHMRRGDFVKHRPDTVANLDVAIEAVDKWLNEAPDAGILLCTDDGAPLHATSAVSRYEGVRETFQSRYGPRVIWTTPRSLDRRTPEAIQDGLVDLWLLRQTDFFVGTKGSSFSMMAAYGRGVPFVMARGATEVSGAYTEFYRRPALRACCVR